VSVKKKWVLPVLFPSRSFFSCLLLLVFISLWALWWNRPSRTQHHFLCLLDSFSPYFGQDVQFFNSIINFTCCLSLSNTVLRSHSDDLSDLYHVPFWDMFNSNLKKAALTVIDCLHCHRLSFCISLIRMINFIMSALIFYYRYIIPKLPFFHSLSHPLPILIWQFKSKDFYTSVLPANQILHPFFFFFFF